MTGSSKTHGGHSTLTGPNRAPTRPLDDPRLPIQSQQPSYMKQTIGSSQRYAGHGYNAGNTIGEHKDSTMASNFRSRPNKKGTYNVGRRSDDEETSSDDDLDAALSPSRR